MDIFNPSHYFLNPHGIPFLVSGTIIIILGIFVLVRNLRSALHISFFFVCLATGTWLLGTGAGYMSATKHIARIWFLVGFTGVIYISTFNYFFTVTFLNKIYRQRWIAGGLFVITTFFLIQLYVTPGFYLGVEKHVWGYYARLGSASYPFLIFFFAVILAAYAQYFTSWRRESNPSERKKILAIFLAYLLVYLAALDYLPVYGISYYPLGHTPALIWILLIVYTVIRYRLFEITPAIAAPTIIATMADSLLVAQKDGKVIIVNEAASVMIGLPARKILGEPLKRFLPDLAPQLLEKAAAFSGKSNALALEEETILRTSERKDIPVSLSAAVIRDPSGHPVGVTAICHNLSKIKEYVSTLARKKQELEEINAKLIREKDATERINKILMEREMRVIELKKRVAELEKK